MSKRLILILALAFVVGMAFSAYAEVQNVKVSGDIIASYVMRNHFNLANGGQGDKENISQSLFMSQTRVRVDADLTDNVAAVVRLINERVWNGQNDTTANDNDRIDLDLAYVTLKEFLYSPLSLTVGRQEIRFGNGLVIGNAKIPSGKVNIPTDLTERKAFDAIRATLDYDPLVVDILYAKVKQPSTIRNNDIYLLGGNASYALNKKVDLSAYYYLKRDNENSSSTSDSRQKADKVNTVGALISTKPIENMKASIEGAFQFGKNSGTNASEESHKAWALQGMADYTFAKVKYTPAIGLTYTYLSGNKSGSTDTKNETWDAMFYDQALNNITYTILPFSNMSVINLRGSLKPAEDVTLAVNYGYYNQAKKSTTALTSPFLYDGSTAYLSNAALTGKKHLGDAIDVTATYDYTEDVQFGLTAGWFKPGKAFALDKRDANQLIGSMKVTF